MDAALIGPVYASNTRNSRYENGTAKHRGGWRNFRAAQTNFVASYGLHDLLGLSSAGVVTREHVSFEDISGTVKPYARSVSTGAPTVITDGGSALSLHASQWRKVAWEDKAYFFNANDSSYALAEHTVGTNNSFTSIKAPDKPVHTTAAPKMTLSQVLNKDSGSVSAYKTLAFTGIAAGDISVTGTASTGVSKSIVDGHVRLQLAASATGTLIVEITLNGVGGPGSQDFSYNDLMYAGVQVVNALTTPLRIDTNTIKRTLINNDGSPISFVLEGGKDQTTPVNTAAMGRCNFAASSSRSLRDNIVKYKVELTVIASSATSSRNVVQIDLLTLGAINPALFPGKGAGTGFITVFMSYRNSTSGQESDLEPIVSIGEENWNTGGNDLGRFLLLTATASSETGVDKYVLYTAYEDALGGTPVIRRVGIYDDTTELTQYVTASFAEWLLLSSVGSLTPARLDIQTIKCACQHNGSMVWGVKGGTANVRLSYVGQPLRVYDSDDSYTRDDVIGADLTMSPDLTDEPEALHSAGGVLVMLGSRGAYHSFGERPILQRTTKKIPESQGTAGANASCEWRDESGVPGVAYLSSNLDTVWFVRVADHFSPEIVELSIDERTKIKAWLFGSSTPTAEDIYVGVDPRSDALWVRYQNKAAVYRRTNLVDGQRPWEFYDYTVTGTFYDCFFSDLYGMRSMRSTGQIDELEYDSSASFALIEGTNRDGGAAPPEAHWTTKRVPGKRRRVVRFRCDRSDLTARPTVTPTIDGTAQTGVQFASGSEWLHFPPTYVGRDWEFKVTIPEGSAEVRALEWQEAEVDQRYAV